MTGTELTFNYSDNEEEVLIRDEKMRQQRRWEKSWQDVYAEQRSVRSDCDFNLMRLERALKCHSIHTILINQVHLCHLRKVKATQSIQFSQFSDHESIHMIPHSEAHPVIVDNESNLKHTTSLISLSWMNLTTLNQKFNLIPSKIMSAGTEI